MDYRKDAHRVYMLTYHMIFVVKYRRPVLDDEICAFLKEKLSAILENNNGSLIEFNGDKDHIHVLFEISPDVNLAHWIRGVKGALARKVRDEFPEKLKPFLWGDAFWTESYFLATSGGVALDVLQKYVEDQGKPKRKYRKRQSKS